ncbi:glycosyltransferase family A protein [Rhodococcus sp. Q]|uniref:glycosyltransferase n=1 Tax=Rhodococcus sp. Q TaxID=2502252 RepID=UPI0010F6BF52|nr:glycosyltransferase family A protein [Rhodococcus sp. Q]
MTRRFVGVPVAVSAAGLAIAALNAATAPRLRAGSPVTEPVTVCIPARDEVETLPRLVADLRAQRGVPDLRILILDDDSGDGTAAAAIAAAAADGRFSIEEAEGDPPAGWLGKPHACSRLADLSADRGGVLVFLDADVRLAPDALAAAARALRELRVDLLSPWPFQVAVTAGERLLQPLLGWSWLATAPLPIANRSMRPSMAVACGQFLVFDAAAYRAVGGHRAVASCVAEDLELARTMRRAGRRTAVAVAGEFASCRMYSSAAQVRDGHGRWLWTQFGSPVGAAAVLGVAVLGYTTGPLVTRPRRWGAAAFAAAVASRLLARRVESGRGLTVRDGVDAAAHPLSVVGLAALTADSHLRRRRGTLTWKNRPLRGS